MNDRLQAKSYFLSCGVIDLSNRICKNISIAYDSERLRVLGLDVFEY